MKVTKKFKESTEAKLKGYKSLPAEGGTRSARHKRIGLPPAAVEVFDSNDVQKKALASEDVWTTEEALVAKYRLKRATEKRLEERYRREGLDPDGAVVKTRLVIRKF